MCRSTFPAAGQIAVDLIGRVIWVVGIRIVGVRIVRVWRCDDARRDKNARLKEPKMGIEEATIEAEARSHEGMVKSEARTDETTVESGADKTAIEAALEASPSEPATSPATLSRDGG